MPNYKLIYFNDKDKPLIEKLASLAKKKGTSFSKLVIEAIKELEG